ncbi:RDD family protein [Blastococcus litoris]|uniref:RDD family protein n=1 Tax=Blastococcus litoris TaxID=2171622 RepID=UPI001F135536|nr:RDD family protein [Blastococcus litoris]
MTTDERQPAYPWHDSGPTPSTRLPSAVVGTRAGLVTRSLANVVDVGVVLALLAGGYLGVAAVRFLIGPTSFSFPVVPAGAFLLIGLGIQALYFTVTWAVAGATYGDRLLGLQVCDDRGARLRWARSAIRAGLCTVFPVGLLWVLVSGENRSVQDALLRTSVVYA